MCNCEVCQRHMRIKGIVKGDDIEAKNALILELAEHIDHVELDLAMTRSILEAKSPRDIEKLVFAIEKAGGKVTFEGGNP